MGSGTYYAVGWGCAVLPSCSEDNRQQLFGIFEEHDIQTSYQGASAYAVIPLLSTLEGCCDRDRDREIPSGVMPIEELADAIKKQVRVKVARATKIWRAVQEAAATLDVPVNLPDGRLLWFCDHD
jgi:hypothetical protein